MPTPSPAPRTRPVRTALGRALTCCAALLASTALAHATLVFGTLTTEPAAPVAGGSVTIELFMVDPTQVPVEDAVVLAELTPPDDETPTTVRLEPTAEPGRYRGVAQLGPAGDHRLFLRDQTFRQEEATAELTLPVGSGPVEPIEFIFPPTATGGGVAAWLAWLIGIPLLAGVIVTVLVLTGGRGEPDEGAAADGLDA